MTVAYEIMTSENHISTYPTCMLIRYLTFFPPSSRNLLFVNACISDSSTFTEAEESSDIPTGLLPRGPSTSQKPSSDSARL